MGITNKIHPTITGYAIALATKASHYSFLSPNQPEFSQAIPPLNQRLFITKAFF
ncbi:hypothetical protein [Nostoc sp.]|uniref:hypothetical protein n=1 Tax=Nostoc sp. TaxID=1180 RepID=UPI0035935672